MIKLNIDVTKIPKERIRAAGQGKYVDMILQAYKNGRDERGNDGMIVMDVTRDERLAGQRGAIVGNWKDLTKKSGPSQHRTNDEPNW